MEIDQRGGGSAALAAAMVARCLATPLPGEREDRPKKTFRGEANDTNQKWLPSSGRFDRTSSTSFSREYTQNLVILILLILLTKQMVTTEKMAIPNQSGDSH